MRRAMPFVIAGALFLLPTTALGWSLSATLAAAELAQANPYSLGLVTKELKTLPKLIVLIHGATPSPSDAATAFVPQPNSGTLDFTRFYFSYSFARRLLGGPTSLKTLGGVNVSDTQWDAHGSANSSHKVSFLHAVDENQLNDHFIVPGDHTGTATPALSLLLTYRDASQGLMPQTKVAINQIYDKYTRLFGTSANPISGKVRPNIILVGHSMGTLVSRALLTAPSDSIQNQSLTAEEQQKAKAIADRTIALVSLAGPHQGSPLANRSTDISAWLQGDGKTLIDTFSLVLPDAWKAAANDARVEMARNLGKDATRDLRVDFWTQQNTGALAPHLARRSDGTLVPVYTLIGHTPGGGFFVNPDTQWPTGGILASLNGTETNRRNVLRALGLMFVDYALHNVPTSTTHKRWGGSPPDEFDLVARYHRKMLGATLSAPGEDEGIPFGIPKFYNRDHVTEPTRDLFGNITGTRVVRTNRDNLVDADGLVDVASGHGHRLGTSTNYYFDHGSTYNVGGTSMRGSWYRVMPQDGWKYSNHETIHRLSATGDWIHDNIVVNAGPLPGEATLSVWPILIRRDFDRTTMPSLTGGGDGR